MFNSSKPFSNKISFSSNLPVFFYSLLPIKSFRVSFANIQFSFQSNHTSSHLHVSPSSPKLNDPLRTTTMSMKTFSCLSPSTANFKHFPAKQFSRFCYVCGNFHFLFFQHNCSLFDPECSRFLDCCRI